ncbi:hypothetical protein M1N23_00040 [Dehalococcoidia bacterium]|nr:hypothetical protein [Dehalococcoidia bacterium]
MINSLLNILCLVFVMTVAAGLGLLIFHRMKLSTGWTGETLVVSAGFGFIAIIYGTACLASVSMLSETPVYGFATLLAVGAAVGYWHWKSSGVDDRCTNVGSVAESSGRWGRWLYIVLGGMGIVLLLSAMAPPLEGDTLHAYLEVPRRYVDAGGIVDLPYEFFASLPLNMQMLSAFALIFRGDQLAQMLTGFGMAIGGASVAYLIGRRYFSPLVATLAPLLYLSTHTVEYLVPSTKVNLGWAFFDLLAVYAVCRWAFDDEHRDRWLLSAGLFSGVALGSAYMAGLTTAILGTFILTRTALESRPRRISLYLLARRAVMYAVPALLLVSPWLIKSFIETGNPVHPFLSSVFGGSSFDKKPPYDGPVGIIALVWDMSTQYAPFPYGKPIGPVFLALLPAVFLVKRLKREVWLALAFVAAYYILWYLFASQRPRNMLTAVALLGVIASYLLIVLAHRERILAGMFIALFTVYLLFEFSFYVRLHFVNLNKLAYVVGLESRSDFLERTLPLYSALPNYSMVSHMNENLPDGARVLAMYTGNGYYVKPEFIDSRMLDNEFENEPPADAEALIASWRQNDITHVFSNDLYPPWEDGGQPIDARILGSTEFRVRYLYEEISDGTQHLYRVNYEGN